MKTKQDCANWLVLINAPYWRVLNYNNPKIIHGASQESEEQPDKKLNIDDSKNFFLSLMDTLPEGNYVLQARTGIKSFANEKSYTFYNGDNAHAQEKPQEKITGLSNKEKEELESLREYKQAHEIKKAIEEANKPLLEKIKKLEEKNTPDIFEKIAGISSLFFQKNVAPRIAKPQDEQESETATNNLVANLQTLKSILGGDEQLTEVMQNLANYAKKNPEQFKQVAFTLK